MLFALLSVSVLAAGQSLVLPYGELRFESASLECTVTCEGETLPVYAMAPGPLMKKVGISPDTEITVYYCTVSGSAAQLGGVRFLRDGAYFTENGYSFGDQTWWSYYFDPEDVGIYRCIEIREKDLDTAPVRFVLHCVSSLPTPAANQCGDDLTWSLTDGTLTVSGTGPMYDFFDLPFDNNQYSDAARPLACPWGDRVEEITSVVVEDGVTGIGNAAFQIGIGLKSVSLPDSVERIGDHAFYGNVFCGGRMDFPKSLKVIGTGAFSMCESLTFSDLPAGVRYIGPGVFADCPGLKSITIPQGVKAVPSYAFQMCSALESVTVPVSVTSIGMNAFLLCGGLKDIWYGGTEALWEQVSVDETNTDYLKKATLHTREAGNLSAGGETLSWVFDPGSGTVTVDELGTGETVYIASYNQQGQMLGLSAVTVSGGSGSVAPKTDRACLFWLDADCAPKCGAGTLK